MSMCVHLDHPLIILAIAPIVQGEACSREISFESGQLRQDGCHDFDTVRARTMILLAHIIDFTFSMAVCRYDQRKTLEEAEAAAIGT